MHSCSHHVLHSELLKSSRSGCPHSWVSPFELLQQAAMDDDKRRYLVWGLGWLYCGISITTEDRTAYWQSLAPNTAFTGQILASGSHQAWTCQQIGFLGVLSPGGMKQACLISFWHTQLADGCYCLAMPGHLSHRYWALVKQTVSAQMTVSNSCLKGGEISISFDKGI